MTHIAMAYIAMADVAMAYVAIAYKAMVRIAMACIVTAEVPLATSSTRTPVAVTSTPDMRPTDGRALRVSGFGQQGSWLTFRDSFLVIILGR